VAAPPLALALAILAMLMALVGAARPRVTAGRGGGVVTLIVDRGATMSGWGESAPRFVETTDTLAGELRRHGAPSAIDLIVVPGGTTQRIDSGALVSAVRALPRTAVDSADALRPTVRRTLTQTAGPLLVVTDQSLGLDDERLVRVAPDRPFRNAGIALIAARESPSPQVMVRVTHTTGIKGAGPVRVQGGTAAGEAEVIFSEAAGEQDVFIDVAGLGDVVSARLAAGDDFEADDIAWLVRESSPPRVEPRIALTAGLRRMVEVYSRARPAAEGASRVLMVNDASTLGGAAGVVVAPAGAEAARSGPARTVPHPVTKHVSIEFAEPVQLAPPPPGEWRAVITVGGAPAVAVREKPSRQVWVGIHAPGWARQPSYVVFWTNVFDWLGGGGAAEWVARPVGSVSPAWKSVELAPARADHPVEPPLWPGIYERPEDGARRALNAPAVSPAAPPALDWRTRLSRVLATQRGGTATPLSPWLLTAAVACLAGAAMSWRGRNLTPFSAGRSVPG
jgi:hypothetical protein